MSWLVVNADDAGLAESTDEAILRCAAAGVLRAATVVANGPTAALFVDRARDAGIDLGLHFNLTQGRALAGPHPTLTDAHGHFCDKHEMWRRAVAGELDADPVRAELVAQWERLVALGVEPSHVDGHNHVHLFPAARAALLELAAGRFVRIPVERAPPPADLPPALERWGNEFRGHCHAADRFRGYAFCADPTEECFLAALGEKTGVTEFMVHPGARPGSPFTSSPLRDRETEVLCAPSLRKAVEGCGYKLAGFIEVPCA